MRKFSVGVIGLGFIGPAHIEGVRRLGFNAAAVAGSTEESTQTKADQLLVPRAYGNWRDLVADPEIDVVHIASPNYLHFAQAKAALEAGKHVVCEKPLAMTIEESHELVHLAAEKRLINAVNFNLRFYPLVQDARARIKGGELGEKIYIIQGSYLQDWLLWDTDWNWRIEPELGGKLRAVADIGSHWIDLITYINRTRISSVFADFATFLPYRRKPHNKLETYKNMQGYDLANERKAIHTEDYAAVLMKFENGARGNLVVSQVSSGRKNRLFFEINGSDSSLMWNSETPNQLMVGHRSEPNEIVIKDPALMRDESRWTASYPGGHAEGFPDTFKQLQKAVYQAIASGEINARPKFPTFVDGHCAMLVNEAILKSANENCWVNVSYED